MEKMVLCLVISKNYIEGVTKTWLLEGRESASVEEVSKVIRPCKLPLMCNVDLDAVVASEKPVDPVFVTRYQKLIGELLYLSVNTMPEMGHIMSCLTRYMIREQSKLPLTIGEFESWADSSWTDVKPSRKSTSCHYIVYNNALVH